MKKDLIEKIDISLDQNSNYREMTILTLQSAKEVLQIYMNLESDYLASQKILDDEITSFRDRTQEVKDKIDEFYSSSSITLEQVKQAEELCEAIKEQILNYSKHIDEMQDKIEADKQEMQSIKSDTQELEKQTEENAKQSTNALNEIEKNKTETLEELKDTFNINLANLEEKISNYDKKIQETQQEIENSKSEFEALATDVKNDITAYIDTSKNQIEQSLKPLSNLSSLDLSHYKFTDNGALFVSDDGVEKKFLLEGDVINNQGSNISESAIFDFKYAPIPPTNEEVQKYNEAVLKIAEKINSLEPSAIDTNGKTLDILNEIENWRLQKYWEANRNIIETAIKDFNTKYPNSNWKPDNDPNISAQEKYNSYQTAIFFEREPDSVRDKLTSVTTPIDDDMGYIYSHYNLSIEYKTNPIAIFKNTTTGDIFFDFDTDIDALNYGDHLSLNIGVGKSITLGDMNNTIYIGGGSQFISNQSGIQIGCGERESRVIYLGVSQFGNNKDINIGTTDYVQSTAEHSIKIGNKQSNIILKGKAFTYNGREVLFK